jgi:hypothetical protein
MQYPVPQFTDVEDKLIGPLGAKQFFIVFGAGILIFAGYSATKSVAALILLIVVFGLPALGLAFAKINGRPAYRQLGFLMSFFTAPKKLVFHKEAVSFSDQTKMKDVKLEAQAAGPVESKETTQQRLKTVQELLRKQQQEEEMLIDKIEHN